MIDKLALTLLLAAGLAAPAWALDGVMLRDDTLRATAAATAGAVGKAAKGSTVTVLARQGGWTQVRAGGKTGWVRLLSVRSGSAGSGAADLAAVGGLAERRDPSKVVAVAGLRGLSEEELRSAHYDAQAMQRLERQAVAAADARRFAAEAGLASRQVAYLPDPKPKGNNNSSWGGPEF